LLALTVTLANKVVAQLTEVFSSPTSSAALFSDLSQQLQDVGLPSGPPVPDLTSIQQTIPQIRFSPSNLPSAAGYAEDLTLTIATSSFAGVVVVLLVQQLQLMIHSLMALAVMSLLVGQAECLRLLADIFLMLTLVSRTFIKLLHTLVY
jgi:hypothetical protein